MIRKFGATCWGKGSYLVYKDGVLIRNVEPSGDVPLESHYSSIEVILGLIEKAPDCFYELTLVNNGFIYDNIDL